MARRPGAYTTRSPRTSTHVCSQCLQRQVDPATGRETLVFSCYNQDQPLDCVDFKFLAARLRQNSAAEKLTSLWLDHLFERREVQLV